MFFMLNTIISVYCAEPNERIWAKAWQTTRLWVFKVLRNTDLLDWPMKLNTTDNSWPLSLRLFSRLFERNCHLRSSKKRHLKLNIQMREVKTDVCKEFEGILAAVCLLALLANTCCTQQTHRLWRRHARYDRITSNITQVTMTAAQKHTTHHLAT